MRTTYKWRRGWSRQWSWWRTVARRWRWRRWVRRPLCMRRSWRGGGWGRGRGSSLRPAGWSRSPRTSQTDMWTEKILYLQHKRKYVQIIYKSYILFNKSTTTTTIQCGYQTLQQCPKKYVQGSISYSENCVCLFVLQCWILCIGYF